jgi:hypothetical protein
MICELIEMDIYTFLYHTVYSNLSNVYSLRYNIMNTPYNIFGFFMICSRLSSYVVPYKI